MNAKKKGNAGENKFANWLVENGIKAWKDSASGGGTNEKGDIGNNLNLHLEVKTVKKINLQEVWKKALHECEKTHNTPVVAIHFDGMPEKEWIMCLPSYYWLELIKGEEEIETTYEDPRRRFDIINLINALRKVQKHYDEQ